VGGITKVIYKVTKLIYVAAEMVTCQTLTKAHHLKIFSLADI
jgi:hypothetical protein